MTDIIGCGMSATAPSEVANESSVNGQRNSAPSAAIFGLRLRTLFFIGVFSLTILLVAVLWHWQFLIGCICILLPTVRLIFWWRKHREFCTLDHVISSYALGSTILFIAATGVGFVAWIITALFFYLLFDSMTASSGVKVWIWFVEVFRWTAFIFVEELCKLCFVRHDRLVTMQRGNGNERAHVIAASASALGYATAQSILFLWIVTLVMESDEEHKIDNTELAELLIVTIIFSCISMPLNVMTSYLEAVAVAQMYRREPPSADDTSRRMFPPMPRVREFFSILIQPVMIRTLFVIQFFFWAAVCLTAIGSPILLIVCVIITSVVIYLFTFYRLRRAAKESPGLRHHDLLQSMYGFRLLEDDHGLPAILVPQAEPHDPDVTGEGVTRLAVAMPLADGDETSIASECVVHFSADESSADPTIASAVATATPRPLEPSMPPGIAIAPVKATVSPQEGVEL